ncbi:MAG: DNA-binding response regulator [Spirulina sp. DLM2.Bin59]|nr:MAG: DNA-binding response regulator [Spirulina sp. DLM2.Bin59]
MVRRHCALGRFGSVGSGQILIIESNPHLRSLLGWHLQQAGYRIHQAAGLQQAREFLNRHQPPLVILEPDLPDGNGLELCQWLFQQRQSLVLILSAKDGSHDVVTGLKAGADDYLKKPFGMQELMARVDALLRRCRVTSVPLLLNYGDLSIDLVQRRVHLYGRYIDLTPQEFSLLYVLAQAEGAPLSRSELLHRAWPDAIDNPRTIDTHVLSLRKKLVPTSDGYASADRTDHPSLIQTVRNVGYCFNIDLLKTEGETSETQGRSPLPVSAGR